MYLPLTAITVLFLAPRCYIALSIPWTITVPLLTGGFPGVPAPPIVVSYAAGLNGWTAMKIGLKYMTRSSCTYSYFVDSEIIFVHSFPDIYHLLRKNGRSQAQSSISSRAPRVAVATERIAGEASSVREEGVELRRYH